MNRLPPNPAVNRTACKLRLQAVRPSASAGRLRRTVTFTVSLRLLFTIVATLLPLCATAETFSLSASPGEFNPKILGNPSPRTSLTATVEITKFAPSKDWPPAAYVGFFQGKSRANSVQFIVIRNHETDSYVVAGLRVIEDGKEVKVISLANIALNTKANLSLSIDSGVVTLMFPPGAPVMLRTNLAEVSPYVSVSSCTAEFTVGP